MKALKFISGIVLSVAVALVACLLEGVLENLLKVHVIGSAVIAMFLGIIINSFVKMDTH